MRRYWCPLLVSFFAASGTLAEPIELTPGIWQIISEETQDVASDGRIGSSAPQTSTEHRCLDIESAWLVPADYAESFTSRGCQQTSFLATPLNFKGVWTCRVDGLDLTINMKGEASLTGKHYSTLMTVTGRNDTKSVNVQNKVTAVHAGECPADGILPAPPAEDVVLRGR